MPLPILYSFRRCPYAIRARLALKYAGVAVELREIALRNKPAEMLAVSPKGTVPVLQLTSGEVLEESLDIMRWALAQSDPQGWLHQGDASVGEALIAINDGPFKILLDRYKYADRDAREIGNYSGSASSAVARRDAAVELHIAPLARKLQATHFLLGDKPSLADMAIVPFVRQFAQVDAAWFADEAAFPYPALRRWLDGLLATDLFAQIRCKQPPWKSPDAVAGEAPITVF